MISVSKETIPIPKKAERPYQQCVQCVMDTNDDPHMTFDNDGVCYYCHYYKQQTEKLVKSCADGEAILKATVEKIKAAGSGKTYDCLIGLSGGVDSSYVAYLAKRLGLRPLCIHFDNGWNSELSVANIHTLVNRLGFDLETYVVDWEEFRDVQLAYLKASVIDIEAVTDHAIYGTLYRCALKNNIPYILGGHNVATEGVLPFHWTYHKEDDINIKAIHKAYGTRPLKTFPFYNDAMKRRSKRSGIEIVNILNWIHYDKDAAKAELQKAFGWRDYGGKHHESIWTRFYQSYILPRKFGVDKRKAHLSSLICVGQLSREEALMLIERPVYDDALLQTDKNFVLKKLGLSEAEWEALMTQPVRNHREFDTQGSLFNHYPVLKPFRFLWQGYKRLGLPKPSKPSLT